LLLGSEKPVLGSGDNSIVIVNSLSTFRNRFFKTGFLFFLPHFMKGGSVFNQQVEKITEVVR